MAKTAAEINAERIEDLIYAALLNTETPYTRAFRTELAHKIVEAFPELRPPQFTSERDGTSRMIVTPVPWKDREEKPCP